jgi:hypothetical protein
VSDLQNPISSSAKKTAQQLNSLLLPVVQGGLLLTVRIWMILVAAQSPTQAMSTAMAWPAFILPLGSALRALTIKSSKPSPLTSPAVETEVPLTRAKPTFADINGDGKLDLVVGETDNNLNYYQNTGIFSNPVYTK